MHDLPEDDGLSAEDALTGQRFRWTPAPGQQVFLSTGGSEDVRAAIDLVWLELILPEGNPISASVVLRFTVTLDAFQHMVAQRWFDIPVTFLDRAGLPFVADRPLVVEVATRPITRMGVPLTMTLFGAAPGEELAAVVAPFVDPDMESTVNNPLLFEVVRVHQPDEEGMGPSFDRAQVEAWDPRA